MPEFGIGSIHNQTPNHLAALERERRKEKIAEATRMLLTSSPPGSALDTLAELVKSPQQTARRITELKEAQKAHDESAAKAQARIEAAQHAEANLATKERAAAAKIEKDEADHQKWIASEKREIQAERATITRLKNEADADRVAAAKDRAEAQRRLRAMEGGA